MTRYVYLLVTLIATLLIFGCGTNAPVTTDTGTDVAPEMSERTADVIMTIDLSGLDNYTGETDFKINLTEVVSKITRTAQYDMGTDMTPDEVRQYFAVNVTLDIFPDPPYTGEYWDYVRCYLYKEAGVTADGVFIGNVGLIGAMGTFTDAEITAIVFMMEWMGYDVPNGPPPDPIC